MRAVCPLHKRQLDVLTETIRTLRLDAGISQRDLSKQSKVHYTTIAKVEMGINYYSLPSLIEIAKTLNIKLSTILEMSNL